LYRWMMSVATLKESEDWQREREKEREREML
jgi:hypothetical protein